jgi:hypothetical protein
VRFEDRSPQKQSNGSSAPVSYSPVVGSLSTPLLIRPRLWRSLPLFPVKKFDGQEMGGRTLKVEITKSGGAGGKDGGYRSIGERSGRY